MDWRLWQLLDSGFPIGGFAHSSGLEAALAHGLVGDIRDHAGRFVRQLGRGALPFVNAAHAAREASEIDRRCDAFLAQPVARRSSALMGRALVLACERAFSCPPPDATHFAPAFGACLRWLGVSAEQTRAAFVHTQLRGMLSAAVRLGALGPYEAQAVQAQLSVACAAVVHQAASYGLDDAAQTVPMLDVIQGAHDQLYSRLFQS